MDALVREAVEDVVRHASAEFAQAVARLTAAELSAQLEAGVAGGVGGRARRNPRPAQAELSRWAADRQARRVPTFVIELTGLTTKKQVVATYGEGAVFEKGRPLPKARP
jgi:hypothetical protein